jgi:hypothetical protein
LIYDLRIALDSLYDSLLVVAILFGYFISFSKMDEEVDEVYLIFNILAVLFHYLQVEVVVVNWLVLTDIR